VTTGAAKNVTVNDNGDIGVGGRVLGAGHQRPDQQCRRHGHGCSSTALPTSARRVDGIDATTNGSGGSVQVNYNRSGTAAFTLDAGPIGINATATAPATTANIGVTVGNGAGLTTIHAIFIGVEGANAGTGNAVYTSQGNVTIDPDDYAVEMQSAGGPRLDHHRHGRRLHGRRQHRRRRRRQQHRPLRSLRRAERRQHEDQDRRRQHHHGDGRPATRTPKVGPASSASTPAARAARARCSSTPPTRPASS